MRVALATLLGRDLDPDSLDELFAGGEADAQAGYALAFSLVRHIEEEGGLGATRGIVDRVAAGETFERAVRGATGRSLDDLTAEWRRSATLAYRWVPVLTSTVTLWMLVTGLVFVAWSRKRRRVLEIRARWALEDGEPPPTGPDRGGPAPDADDEVDLDEDTDPDVDKALPDARASLPRATGIPELTPEDTSGPHGPH